jgi:phage FluMu protein Com
MNLRCTYCQTPFTVSRLEKLAAIQRIQAENLHHFDVFCPRCRRANSVSRQRLEIFTPGWQEGLKTLEAEAAQIEKGRKEPAPAPLETKPAPARVEATRNRHASKPTVAAPAPAASKPAAPSSPKGKPVAKPGPTSKPAAKKSVAKAKPAAKAKKPVAKKK